MQTLQVCAWFLGSRLDLREFEPSRTVGLSPLTLALGEEKWLVAFRFGVVVTIGLDEREACDWLDRLATRVTDAVDVNEQERILLVIDPGQYDSIN